MEKISYLPDMHRAPRLAPSPARPAEAHKVETVTSDWRERVPVLTGSRVTLRELEIEDAPSLFSMLTTEEVSRFISPPPSTVEGFERFILWAQRERAAGRYVCFAVVPHGTNTAIGLFQLRQIEAGFASGEWGFAIGSPTGARACSPKGRGWSPTLRSKRSASIGSRRARP